MKKNGFIKSVESVIIVVLVMSIYLLLTEPIFKPSQQFKRDIEKIGESFIQMLSDTGVLKIDLDSFDIRDINAKAAILLPGQYAYQIALKYGTSFEVFNSESINKTERVVYFAYNYPKYIDKNSVSVYSAEDWMDAFVNWTWYEIKIEVQNNDSYTKRQVNIPINANLTADENVSNLTLVFFDNEIILDYTISGWNMANPKEVNATLVVNIPQILPKENKEVFLFYSASSPFNASEYQKSFSESRQGVLTSIFNPLQSSRGDTYARLPLISSNANKTLHLSYQIGSSLANTYNSSMLAYNNTGILIDLKENYVKEGTPPFTLTLPSEYQAFKKVCYTEKLDSEVILRIWSLWQ